VGSCATQNAELGREYAVSTGASDPHHPTGSRQPVHGRWCKTPQWTLWEHPARFACRVAQQFPNPPHPPHHPHTAANKHRNTAPPSGESPIELERSHTSQPYYLSYLCEPSADGNGKVLFAHVCGRVHGRKQPEVRVALDGLQIPSLGQREAPVTAFQQSRQAVGSSHHARHHTTHTHSCTVVEITPSRKTAPCVHDTPLQEVSASQIDFVEQNPVPLFQRLHKHTLYEREGKRLRNLLHLPCETLACHCQFAPRLPNLLSPTFLPLLAAQHVTKAVSFVTTHKARQNKKNTETQSQETTRPDSQTTPHKGDAPQETHVLSLRSAMVVRLPSPFPNSFHRCVLKAFRNARRNPALA